MARYLPDSNVLLRTANKASAQHGVCTLAIASLIRQRHEILLAPQVLREFWSVATRPQDANGFGWPTGQVLQEIDRLLKRFPLLTETDAVFDEWLRLVVEKQVIGKQTHDAHLAAFHRVYQFDYLLTFNTAHFGRYGINTVSPEEIVSSQ